MTVEIFNNFIDAIIKTEETTILFEGIEYYSIEKNYNLDNVEYLTIDYKNREIICHIQCFLHNNNIIIFCDFENDKIVNNVNIKGIYIIVNKIIKLTLKYITCYASFNKNCCDYFNDIEEIHRNEIKLLEILI